MTTLIEKVARAINCAEWGAALSMSEAELAEKSEMARAAIAAVAEWIGDHEHIDTNRSAYLALVWQYTQKSKGAAGDGR